MAMPPGYQWLPPRCHKATGHEGEHATFGAGGFVERWDDAGQAVTGSDMPLPGPATGLGATQGVSPGTGATETANGPQIGGAA
jgi:hypothetical protein